jgi:hypothetical protein
VKIKLINAMPVVKTFINLSKLIKAFTPFLLLPTSVFLDIYYN